MKTVIPSFFLFLLISLIPAADAPRLATPQDAIHHLQKLWRDSLAAKLKGNSHYALLERQILDTANVKAEAIRSAEARKQMAGIFSSEYVSSNVVLGKLENFKSDRPLWAVSNPSGIVGNFEAYLDAATGELLLLWIVPEG